MEIKKIKIKNFLGIDELNFDPGKLNLIKGKNGKGKTSIIEAIRAAFRGADAKKIRLGRTKAEIYVETENVDGAGFSVTRRIQNGSKGSVSVSNNGKSWPKPQSFLDGIVGDFSFEPVKFFLMPDKTQTGYLLEAIKCSATVKQLEKWTRGLIENVSDYAQMHGLKAVAELRDCLYEERKSINRRVKSLRGAVEEAQDRIPSGLPKFDASRWQELTGRLSDMKANEEKMVSLRQQFQDREGDLKDIERQMVALKKRQEAKEKEKERIERDMLNVEIEDHAELEAEIAKLNEAQASQRQVIELEKLKKELQGEEEDSEELDKAVKSLQNDAPAELIASVDMPIKGLEYNSDIKGFALKGVPISELSTSEKARFAVAVTKKINSGYKLKLVCLDGFEALDQEVQKAFLAQATKDGFQYFVTEVSEDAEIKLEAVA